MLSRVEHIKELYSLGPGFAEYKQLRHDQRPLPYSLLSAFLIHSLERQYAELDSCQISAIQLVSVAEGAGLSLIWL